MEVKAIIKADRRVTVQDIALDVDLSVGTVHTILHEDLHLSKLAARWVPRLLTEEHKEKRLEMARDFTKRLFEQGEAFLRSIVTMDESWVESG